jgi:hypothetical protein
MPEGWGDFLVAEVGASAALGGLVFVGLSLNLDRILAFPGLANRAFIALALLVTVLVICSLMLVPGQSQVSIAIETLAVGGMLWIAGTRAAVLALSKGLYYSRRTFINDALFFQVAVLPYLIGGVLGLMGRDVGLLLVAAAIILSFVKAVLEAWVLLVEIKR